MRPSFGAWHDLTALAEATQTWILGRAYEQGSWGPAEADTLPGPHGSLLERDDAAK